MKKLRIIEELCRIGNTESIGVFSYNELSDVEDVFGKIASIQINRCFIFGDYMYDYSCELSSKPDIVLFTEDEPDEPIGLYLIED